MISRELHRPLYEPLHRDLDRTREGIGGGEGVTLVLTAPDGAYAGAQAVVTGGTPIVYVDGEYAPITADVGETITPYMFIINGLGTGVWFESPTTFPEYITEGDTIQVQDAVGNVSNILTVSWDVDAADYFSRAETLEADAFDLGVGYGAPLVKGFWSRFVDVLKTDGTWEQIDEIFPGSGVTFGGIAAKLKYNDDPVVTLNGFVEANFNPTGAEIGLIGNGTSTYIDTNWAPSDTITGPSLHHSVFSSAIESGATNTEGCRQPGNDTLMECYLNFSNGQVYDDALSELTGRVNGACDALGHVIGNSTATSHRLLQNGSLIVSGASPVGTPPSIDYYFFATNRSGIAEEHNASRRAIRTLGRGLTEAQEETLTNAVSTLMSKLGY